MDNFLIECLNRSVFLELRQSGRCYGDYACKRKMLLERHGVKSDIEVYADVLKNHLGELRKNDTVIIMDNIFKDIDGCFFDEFCLKISSDLESSITYPVVLNKNGNIRLFKCDIKINSREPYHVKVEHIIERFYHEFNHVYEEYCRLVKGAPSMFDRITDKDSVYRKISGGASVDDNMRFKNTINMINQILYLLDDTESNAFATSVHVSLTEKVKKRIEDIQKTDRLTDFTTIENVLTDIIKNDSTYTRFERARENINILSSDISRAYYVETYWKELFGKETRHYIIMKKIKSLFAKKWKHFRITASKAVYDAYLKYTIRPVPELGF